MAQRLICALSVSVPFYLLNRWLCAGWKRHEGVTRSHSLLRLSTPASGLTSSVLRTTRSRSLGSKPWARLLGCKSHPLRGQISRKKMTSWDVGGLILSVFLQLAVGLVTSGIRWVWMYRGRQKDCAHCLCHPPFLPSFNNMYERTIWAYKIYTCRLSICNQESCFAKLPDCLD